MEENRVESMEKALKNPLILHTIFRKLNSSDLLDCRLVSRLNWFDLATKLICKRNGITINFDFTNSLASGEYTRAFENPFENPWSLKSLVNCIRNSTRFPCSRFRFLYADLDNVDLLEFFLVYGNFIIELEMDLMARTNVNSAIEKFGEILLNQLPNLEKLVIWKMNIGDTSLTSFFPKEIRATAKLPKLKFLESERTIGGFEYQFIRDIQKAAPNLQNVQKIPFVYPEVNPSKNFIFGADIFPHLKFYPQKANFGFYARVVRAKAKFSRIYINLEHLEQRPEVLSRATEILTEILDLSRSTLIQLDGAVGIFALTGINLNLLEFPLVQHLNLQTPGKKYPTGKQKDQEEEMDFSSSNLVPEVKSLCKISQSFPCLSEIWLESLDFLQNCPDSIQTVKKVKSETLFCTAQGFQNLAKVFPMLENLELNNIKNFKDCAGSLWENFGALKNLELGILLHDSDRDEVSLDKYIVGTSGSSISKLRELKSLHLKITPIPSKIEPGTRNSPLGKGGWEKWNFLNLSTVYFMMEKFQRRPEIKLTVNARETNCTDLNEIFKKLKHLEPLVKIKVEVDYCQAWY